MSEQQEVISSSGMPPVGEEFPSYSLPVPTEVTEQTEPAELGTEIVSRLDDAKTELMTCNDCEEAIVHVKRCFYGILDAIELKRARIEGTKTQQIYQTIDIGRLVTERMDETRMSTSPDYPARDAMSDFDSEPDRLMKAYTRKELDRILEANGINEALIESLSEESKHFLALMIFDFGTLIDSLFSFPVLHAVAE